MTRDEQDAARYRYLRDTSWTKSAPKGAPVVIAGNWNRMDTLHLLKGEDMDKRIDESMQKHGEK